MLLLLRAHLQRSDRARKRTKSSGAERAAPRQSAVERAQQIASAEGLSPNDVARALISGLLTEEFGDSIANDARFQQMVDEVTSALRADAAGGKLLKAAVRELGG